MRIVKSSFLLFALAQLASTHAAVAQPAPAPEGAPAPAPEAPPAPAAAPAPEAAPAPAPAPEAAAPAPAPPPPADDLRPAPASLKIETPSSSLKLGVLFQPQFEAASSPLNGVNGMSTNLFVRRVRLLASATLFKNLDFFFDTDFSNLFKAGPDGTKATPGLNIQDAFGTFKALDNDALKVDVGYMLPPSTHNAVQGAGTLYGLDYYGYSFQNSNSFSSTSNPIGRDAGVQLRGLVLDKHIEYRAGLFQGRRNPPGAGHPTASNMFRIAGRVQINILDPETGFFYAGTYLGKKKVLSVGGTIDIQDKYLHWGADAFLDMPIGPGVLTAQVNVAGYDGKTFLVGPVPAPIPPATTPGPAPSLLRKQTAIMGEAGYLIDAINVSPIIRFENDSFSASSTKETRIGGGVAFWPYGHAFNVKAFFMNVKPETTTAAPTRAYNQINVQTQVYVF